jgi:hypothetical protein
MHAVSLVFELELSIPLFMIFKIFIITGLRVQHKNRDTNVMNTPFEENYTSLQVSPHSVWALYNF